MIHASIILYIISCKLTNYFINCIYAIWYEYGLAEVQLGTGWGMVNNLLDLIYNNLNSFKSLIIYDERFMMARNTISIQHLNITGQCHKICCPENAGKAYI
jgi:hypothetical protein